MTPGKGVEIRQHTMVPAAADAVQVDLSYPGAEKLYMPSGVMIIQCKMPGIHANLTGASHNDAAEVGQIVGGIFDQDVPRRGTDPFCYGVQRSLKKKQLVPAEFHAR